MSMHSDGILAWEHANMIEQELICPFSLRCHDKRFSFIIHRRNSNPFLLFTSLLFPSVMKPITVIYTGNTEGIVDTRFNL